MKTIGVTQAVVQYLRDCIITREVACGEGLDELGLSSRLGISGPPHREAFRVNDHE